MRLEKSGARFLAGERPSVADASAFPFLWRLSERFDLVSDSTSYPAVAAWLEAFGSIEAVKQTVVRSWWWWW
jgi:glutathione S-transferase